MFAMISAVVLAGTFTACVTKENVPEPPKTPEPAKTAEPAKTPEPAKTTETAKPAAGDDLAAKGKAIYEGAGNCASCHGKDGAGVLPTAPKFNDATWQAGIKDDAMTAAMKDGTKAAKGMPKYAGPEGDIPALVAYVRSFGKKPAGK